MTVLEFKQDTSETNATSHAVAVKNVLYATDFSATSQAAIPYAAGICRKFGSTLHIAHVLSDATLLMSGGVDYVAIGALYEDASTVAKEKIDKIRGQLSGISMRSYVRHGRVWENLSDIVDENEIDLIVVGTHGRTGLGKIVLGSVAEDILRHAPCPVLTVGPKVSGRAKLPEFNVQAPTLAPVDLELQNVLYAANFTDASLRVAPVAIDLAEEFGARLTLIHVLENYSILDAKSRPIEDAVRQLQALVPKNAVAYVPEVIIEFGSPWQAIVNKAAERDADLIVLGAQAGSGTTHLPWSTVHQVVARATCPVLTVRT